MAVSARELLLIVRAQNYASGALRRVARDIRGVGGGGMQQLRMAQAQQRINLETARTTRQRLLDEQRSIETGQRSLAQKRRELTTLQAVRRASLAQMRAERGVGRAAYTSEEWTKRMKILQEQGRIARLGRRQAAAAEERLAQRAGVLNTALATQAQRIALADARFREYDQAIRSARWERIAAGGRVIQHFGRVAQYAAITSGVALGYAANAAAEFRTQATLAATQVANRMGTGADGVVRAADQISTGLLRIMRTSTATSQELNKTAYDIYSSLSLGRGRGAVNRGLALLKQFSDAAIAGQAPLEDVGRAMVSVLNVFSRTGRYTRDSQYFLNRMFAAVRFGRMTLQEFTGTLNQIAPAFTGAFGKSRQTFDQMSGAMAAVSRFMPSVRMGATGLARLTEIFARRDFIRGLRHFGVSITDASGKLIPFDQIIARLTERFPKLREGGPAVTNFFKDITAAGSATGKGGTLGTIQARRVLTALVLHAETYRDIVRRVLTDNNEFAKSLNALRQTPQVQWQVFLNTLRAFAIEIGTHAIPAIISLTKPIVDAVKWFENLSTSTKEQIGRWLVYGTAIFGVTAALSNLLGIFVRLFSFVGRGIGFFPAMAAGIVAVSAVLVILNGHFRDLNDFFDNLVSMGTSSLAGWAVTIGIITVAVIKLTRAYTALRTAMLLASVASTEAGVAQAVAAGGGGAIAGAGARLGRGLASARAAGQLTREAIRTEGAFAGIASAMTLIPIKIPAVIAGVAAIAGGVYLWKRHLDEVQARNEEIRREMEQITRLARAPVEAFRRFGDVGTTTESALRAADAVQTARIRLRGLNREIAAAPRGTDRYKQLLIDRREAIYDLKDAQDAHREAVNKANQSLLAVAQGFQAVGRNTKYLQDATRRMEGLTTLRAELERQIRENPTIVPSLAYAPDRLKNLAKSLGVPLTSGFSEINRRIDITGRRMGVMLQQSARWGQSMRTNISSMVKDFQGLRLLPPRLPRGTVGNLMQLFLLEGRRGRIPTLREMKMLITAEYHPDRRMPPIIRQALAAGRRARAAQRGQVINIPANVRAIAGPRERRTAAQRILGIFRRVLTPEQLGKVNEDAVKLGAEIIQGMTQGVRDNKTKVAAAVIEAAREATDAGRTALDAKSPSRVFYKLGTDVVSGLVNGVKNGTPLVRRASENLAIALVPDLKANERLTARNVQRQLTGQLGQLRRFNRDIAMLQRRGVPKGLIEQLAEGGLDNLKLLNTIVGMTPKQLQTYVEAWRKAMAQIDDSSEKQTRAEEARKERRQRAVEEWTQRVQTAVENLMQVYQQFYDQNQQAMGSITEGVRTANQMQAGARFPNVADLMGDARDQLKHFREWRSELARLRKIGAPPELIRQIREAGPQEGGFIARGVLRMTPGQRRAYFNMIREQQRAIREATRIDFNNQLRDWRRHGRRAAIQFMLGMRDEQSWIKRQMRQIFITSWLRQHPRDPGRPHTGHTTVHNNNSVHVHNPKEDLRTTLRKAGWKKQQKSRPR